MTHIPTGNSHFIILAVWVNSLFEKWNCTHFYTFSYAARKLDSRIFCFFSGKICSKKARRRRFSSRKPFDGKKALIPILPCLHTERYIFAKLRRSMLLWDESDLQWIFTMMWYSMVLGGLFKIFNNFFMENLVELLADA